MTSPLMQHDDTNTISPRRSVRISQQRDIEQQLHSRPSSPSHRLISNSNTPRNGHNYDVNKLSDHKPPGNSVSTTTSQSDSTYVSTIGWILSSTSVSVGIILVNKYVMNNYGFKFVFTLTSLHLLVTGIGMYLASLFGLFERRRLPFSENLLMSIFCIGSVAFMNFSLKYNSVGFYQVCKLMCIPCMVFIQQYITKQQTFSNKIRLTLVFVILGVAIATVTDVQLNVTGSIMGVLAIIFTTQFQIWQGEKQKSYSMSSMQMNESLSFTASAICAVLALIFETHGKDAVQNYQFNTTNILWILLSSLLALGVNLASYGLIGATSPVTYQVVGHAKTCLVLTGGFIMYPVNDTIQLYKNLIGIVIAMIGVIGYTDVKQKESKSGDTDIVDKLFPTAISNALKK